MNSLITLFLLAIPVATIDDESADVIVVVGVPGSEEFAESFRTWGDRIEESAQQAGAGVAVIGQRDSGDSDDKELLKRAIRSRSKDSQAPLWIILLGHGTFDGKKAKFNLRGPDVSSQELAEWTKDLERPIAIVNCASSSAPFINALAGPNRIIVTATKSGYEQNFSRFGEYFSEGLVNPKADLDKDEQTSLLEAFLYASHGVAEFFETESRLATEHALIDDNGDGKGTPFDWFRGVRVTKTAQDNSIPDGVRANQIHLVTSDVEKSLDAETRARRDVLEVAVEQLRQKKSTLSEDEYYERLESLVAELAHLYWPDDDQATDSEEPVSATNDQPE